MSEDYYDTNLGGDRRRQDPVTAWEKHGQTIITGVVMVLLSWVGLTVNDNAKESAVMASQIMGLKRQVDGLEKSLSNDMLDRYRGRDAERDFSAVYKEINRIRDDNHKFMKEQAARGPRIKALEDAVKEFHSRKGL